MSSTTSLQYDSDPPTSRATLHSPPMTGLLDRVLLPVASVDDARASATALEAADGDVGRVVAVHVIEKAGGGVDKASVEQREERADDIFAAVHETLEDAETDVVYGTDVADAIFAAADEHDATAVVITPRGGSRWIRLLTGDVALSLVTETDLPVVVLPDAAHDDAEREAAAE